MSCLTTLLNNCDNIQESLNAYFPVCAASTFKDPMPFFEFLNSPVNKSGLEQLVSPGEGKYRTVNLRYRKRLVEDSVKVNQTKTCASTDKLGDCMQAYTIDTTQNIQTDHYIPEGYLNASCVSNPNFFMETLMMMIDVIERKAASNAATQSGALFGQWSSDVAVTSSELVVNTLKPVAIDATAPNPLLFQQIDAAIVKSQFCAPVGIFGGDLLWNAYRSFQAGCCANTGVDVSEQFAKYGRVVAYDRRVMNAIGTLASQDKALVVQQGALQLLTWNQQGWKTNLDPIFKGGQNYWAQVIRSPRTGIPIDLRIADNCGDVSIVLTFTGKVVGMPSDMFQAGDLLSGWNGVTKIKVTNT